MSSPFPNPWSYGQWSCSPWSRGPAVLIIIHIIHFWPGKNLIRRALRLIFRHRNFKMTVKSPRATIEGRYADHADFHAVCEVFLERAYDLSSVTPSPTLIVDAGGHIGTFAVLAGLTFPAARLLSFEPDPDNFRLLTRNVARNRVRAHLQNLALANFEGQSLLDGPSSMGRRLGAATGRLVPVRRLSKLIDLDSIQRLLLKLDVEGAEWSILEDCAAELPENTIIFIETHGGDDDLKRLAQFSSRFGFSHEHTRDKGACHESVLRRGAFVCAHLPDDAKSVLHTCDDAKGALPTRENAKGALPTPDVAKGALPTRNAAKGALPTRDDAKGVLHTSPGQRPG